MTVTREELTADTVAADEYLSEGLIATLQELYNTDESRLNFKLKFSNSTTTNKLPLMVKNDLFKEKAICSFSFKIQ